MIAGLIEGNLATHPQRGRLLSGPVRNVTITAEDLDSSVSLTLGGDAISIREGAAADPDLWIRADSETLIDLPNAKLLGGLPSIADAAGRRIVSKLAKGEMKIKGIFKLGLLSRVQRLLSVT